MLSPIRLGGVIDTLVSKSVGLTGSRFSLPFIERIVARKWPVAAQRKALGRLDIPKFCRIVTKGLIDHFADFVDGLPHNLHVVPQTLDGLAEFLHVLARGQVGTAGG